MYEMGEQLERVILAGVQTYESDDTVQSLYELRELAETAGAVTVGTIMQSRETIHPATYLGKGKLEELKELLYDLDATGVICDDELSPAQLNNLEQELECKVMDRTMVILDIFAQRAKTSEGKIQVELAQLKYRAARLVGMRASLSRLGGGIGTRGPGEKKLEIDRRLIKDRIAQLNRELKEVRQHRDITRAQREKNQMPVIAYASLGRGFFSGRMKSEYADHASDYLDSFAMTGYACSDNFERLHRCEIIAERHGVTVAQIAMNWIFSHPLNIFAIASMSKADRMKANREALLLQLSDEEIAYLDLETPE